MKSKQNRSKSSKKNVFARVSWARIAAKGALAGAFLTGAGIATVISNPQVREKISGWHDHVQSAVSTQILAVTQGQTDDPDNTDPGTAEINAITNAAQISDDLIDATPTAEEKAEVKAEEKAAEGEVNEYAQEDQQADESAAVSTSTVPRSPLMKNDSEIDLAYLNGVIKDMVSPRRNSVEADKIEENPDWTFDRAAILADAQNRIGTDFKIPDLLKDRVAFWFDVYTKWDDNHKIIHNSRYPWIVYKVIDIGPIVNADKPGHLWMRKEKADRLVRAETEEIRKALKSLSKKHGAKPELNEVEASVANALVPLGGDVYKQAAIALNEVRVQTGQQNFFESGLSISPRYLSTMEKIFARYKLPLELTRIPFVESSFNKQATSKVGACGIWQFMGNTGRKYMVVNNSIDERRSPFKATEAAARLLKENHLILRHSWPLAVTAWNHGPGGVRIAARAAGSHDLGVIVKKFRSRSFDFASSNFYSEFLGALYAERYSDLAFPPLERVEPIELQVVKLHRSVRVKELLKMSGLTLEQFLMINPDLTTVANRNLPVPTGFRIHVPIETRPTLEKLLASDGSSSEKHSS